MSNEDTEVKTEEAVVDAVADAVVEVEEIPVAEHPDGNPIEVHIFTNDHKNPMLPQLFNFVYNAAFKNKLGVMHALNKETKKVHTLLIGVDYTPDGELVCLPMAKLLTAEEQELYFAPDGVGGFIGYEPESE